MSNIDDKTKAALQGYLISATAAGTRAIDAITPELRSRIEAGNYTGAAELLVAARVQVGFLARELQHAANVLDVDIYPDDKCEAVEKMDVRKIRKASE